MAGPAASNVWSLQASVVHSWPAHKDRVRVVAAHPNECAVLTAGRGAVPGRDGAVPVVRVWSLSDCHARVQYVGHRAAINGMLVLRAARGGGAVVASVDVSGQLHVWSCDSGQQLGVLAAAPVPTQPQGTGVGAMGLTPGGGASGVGGGGGMGVGVSGLANMDGKTGGGGGGGGGVAGSGLVEGGAGGVGLEGLGLEPGGLVAGSAWSELVDR